MCRSLLNLRVLRFGSYQIRNDVTRNLSFFRVKIHQSLLCKVPNIDNTSLLLHELSNLSMWILSTPKSDWIFDKTCLAQLTITIDSIDNLKLSERTDNPNSIHCDAQRNWVLFKKGSRTYLDDSSDPFNGSCQNGDPFPTIVPKALMVSPSAFFV